MKNLPLYDCPHCAQVAGQNDGYTRRLKRYGDRKFKKWRCRACKKPFDERDVDSSLQPLY